MAFTEYREGSWSRSNLSLWATESHWIPNGGIVHVVSYEQNKGYLIICHGMRIKCAMPTQFITSYPNEIEKGAIRVYVEHGGNKGYSYGKYQFHHPSSMLTQIIPDRDSQQTWGGSVITPVKSTEDMWNIWQRQITNLLPLDWINGSIVRIKIIMQAYDTQTIRLWQNEKCSSNHSCCYVPLDPPTILRKTGQRSRNLGITPGLGWTSCPQDTRPPDKLHPSQLALRGGCYSRGSHRGCPPQLEICFLVIL